MTQKTLWFDTETTGLDPVKNDIIQFSAMVEIDKSVIAKIDIKMQPVSGGEVSQEALDVHGYSLEDLAGFMTAGEGYREILRFLDAHIDKFDKGDKFLSAGQNVKFDIEFLRQMFIKNGNHFFGSYFDYHFLDLQAMTAFMIRNEMLMVDNYKLDTVAKAVGVDLSNAHNSMADIEATREVFMKYEQMILGAKNEH